MDYLEIAKKALADSADGRCDYEDREIDVKRAQAAAWIVVAHLVQEVNMTWAMIDNELQKVARELKRHNDRVELEIEREEMHQDVLAERQAARR